MKTQGRFVATARFGAVFLTAWLLACGGGGSSRPNEDIDGGGGGDTPGVDAVVPDALPGDTADLGGLDQGGPDLGDLPGKPDLGGGDTPQGDADGGPGETDGGGGGGFGTPCTSNAECLSGFCVFGPDGRVCSDYCVGDCPDEWVCAVVANPDQDPVSICLYAHVQVCMPCNADAECLIAGSAAPAWCLPLGDGTAGQFCATECSIDVPCPTGYDCRDISGHAGETAAACVPTNDVCTCGDYAATHGGSTTCRVANQFGACLGERHCDGATLTDCDGPAARPERCNGEDDDCDGLFDEDIVGEPCTLQNEFGACRGLTTCQEGLTVCDAPTPLAEDCDGLDNDCDGATDELYPDLDEDGSADCVDPDDDGDGWPDDDDNCPVLPNGDQADCDRNGVGDACEDDDDKDGVLDAADCVPCNDRVYPGAQELCDGLDNNCNGATDEGYTNTDGDALANCVDPDDDNDGILDDGDESGIPGDHRCAGGAAVDCDDNCPLVPNPAQTDLNGDGVGDACVSCANACDGVGLTGCRDIGPIPWVCGYADDGDPCLDLIEQPSCAVDEICENGTCVDADCLHDCQPGETDCLDTLTPWECGYANDGDPCLDRIGQAACAGGRSCVAGECVAPCSDACAAGEIGCLDERTPFICGEAGDGDECRDTIAVSPCAAGESCDAGRCVAGCTDRCLPGETGCIGATTPWLCGEAGDGDACLDQVPATPCGPTEACESGACQPICADECTLGDTGCVDAETSYACGEAGDGDACLEPVPAACGRGHDCVDGACVPTCSDECEALGWVGCSSSTQPWVCVEAGDGDDCYETRPLTPCGPGRQCVNGLCEWACVDECAEGESGCDDEDTAWVCGEANDGDPCREPIVTLCGRGQACADGVCVPLCEDECPTLGALGCFSLTEPWACGNTDPDECYERVALTVCGPRTECVDGLCLSTIIETGAVVFTLASCGVSGQAADLDWQVGLGFATPVGWLAPTGLGYSVDLGIFSELRE